MVIKQKIVGPYRVKNIGANGDVWEVVEMIDPRTNTWEELRPRRTYLHRQPAYGLCLRLNKRWNDDCRLDENYEEMLKLFAEF